MRLRLGWLLHLGEAGRRSIVPLPRFRPNSKTSNIYDVGQNEAELRAFDARNILHGLCAHGARDLLGNLCRGLDGSHMGRNGPLVGSR